MSAAVRSLVALRPVDGRTAPVPVAPTTFRRHELKYWASEEQARELLRAAAGFFEPDPYVAAAGPRGAWNVSLYLDSPGLSFFEQHLAAVPDRCKLRVRTYAPAGRGAPVADRAFLEIKRKVNVMSLKQRAIVPRALARAIAAGTDVATEISAHRAAPRGRDLEAFLLLRERYGARPTMLVRARRQAFFARAPWAVRLTLDRDMECQPTRDADLDGDPASWRLIPRQAGVLVEVKFYEGAPRWLGALLGHLGLRRVAFSKYVAAVGHELRGAYAPAGDAVWT